MKLIYIAGPYIGDGDPHTIKMNILKASILSLLCWKRGWAAICPHKNTEGYEAYEGQDGLTAESWYQGDLEILSRCDAILMVPGWETSKGARKELEYAQMKGLTIYMHIGHVPIIGEYRYVGVKA